MTIKYIIIRNSLPDYVVGLTLLMHSRIVLINTGLIKMLFMTSNQI